MMIYPGMGKTVLILSSSLSISRTFFLVPIDVSLWDMYPKAEQIPLKGSGFESGLWVLLMSRALASCSLLACMHNS